ncbi:MAG: hypothetical protein mread185_000436 [Mycoplasmataceae bacterium]|nr:MAG: hypothetical protein mread185_000436 [Mycoplasmataceae bacterium]
MNDLSEYDKKGNCPELYGKCVISGNTICNITQQQISSLYSKPKVNFVISFLNYYPHFDLLRLNVVHEFTHLYLDWKEIKQLWEDNPWKLMTITRTFNPHDDDFYNQMYFFENWVNKEFDLPERRRKESDLFQHVDPNKRKRHQDDSEDKNLQELESHIQIKK